jgi:hypothetical protein
MWYFADLRFADHIFLRFADSQFADPVIFLRTSANRLFCSLHTYISLKCSHSIFGRLSVFDTVFSYMELRSLKYTYVGKKNITVEANQCGSIRNTTFFPSKIADLRFADWNTKEIYWYEICGLIITNFRLCDLRTGTPQKFVDLRLRKEPKNFRICGLRTNKKMCIPTFAVYFTTNRFLDEFWRMYYFWKLDKFRDEKRYE